MGTYPTTCLQGEVPEFLLQDDKHPTLPTDPSVARLMEAKYGKTDGYSHAHTNSQTCTKTQNDVHKLAQYLVGGIFAVPA